MTGFLGMAPAREQRWATRSCAGGPHQGLACGTPQGRVGSTGLALPTCWPRCETVRHCRSTHPSLFMYPGQMRTELQGVPCGERPSAPVMVGGRGLQVPRLLVAVNPRGRDPRRVGSSSTAHPRFRTNTFACRHPQSPRLDPRHGTAPDPTRNSPPSRCRRKMTGSATGGASPHVAVVKTVIESALRGFTGAGTRDEGVIAPLNRFDRGVGVPPKTA